jgi:hypothetical protein
VVITGCESMERLDQALEAVRISGRSRTIKSRSLLAKTEPHASGGKYEPFKTTPSFDSTALHPEWLGEVPPRTRSLTVAAR